MSSKSNVISPIQCCVTLVLQRAALLHWKCAPLSISAACLLVHPTSGLKPKHYRNN